MIRTWSSGRSTWVNSNRPTLAYGQSDVLKIASGTREVLLSFPLGTELRKGATVASAVVYVPQVGAWSGSRTLTARRVESFPVRSVTWNTKPTSAAGSANRAVTAADTPDGHAWAFTVTEDVQTVVNASGTRLDLRIFSSDATVRSLLGFPGASLVVEWYYAPAAPTGLNPGDDARIGVAKPLLRFTAADFDAIQAQVAPVGSAWTATAGFTTPTFDSSTVTTTVPEFALDGSTYGGLMSGSTSWTVRVRSGGIWSKYATPAAFTRVVKDPVTITQPVAEVWEPTPPLDADMVGMSEVQWLVDLASTGKRIGEAYDSRRLSSTTGQHTPTRDAFTIKGASYRVTARAWPTNPPVANAAVGGEPYSEASVVTVYDDDPGTAGVTSTTVTQVGQTPAIDLTVARAVMPDAFEYQRDGRTVVTGLSPAALEVSPGVYRYRDHSTPPNEPHTHRLAPVVNGHTAKDIDAAQHAIFTTDVGLRWLGDPKTNEWVAITGNTQSWTRPEDATLHVVDRSGLTNPEGGKFPRGSLVSIRRSRGKQPPTGSVSGQVVSTTAGAAGPMIALLEAWQDRTADVVYRYVVGNRSILVNIGDLDVAPTPFTADGPVVDVSFNFWAI